MTIAPAILEQYPSLNDMQREIIAHLDGPLLVIAGPGSGKTYSIVLRALNLLLLEKALPRQIVLCTFTEKAAFEMRDRLAAAARKVGYAGDLSELTASTIHSFSNRVLTQHRQRTDLGHSYNTVDELTQLLFIFEHFDEIIGPAENDLFLRRWRTRWTAIEGARAYFDKITEELVEPDPLVASDDPFLRDIGNACRRYERTLLDENRTDFAHLQRLVFGLLQDAATAAAGAAGRRQARAARRLRAPALHLRAHPGAPPRPARGPAAALLDSEPRKEYALMVLPYDPKRVEEAGRHFDETVRRIQAWEFAVTTPPEVAICKECDLKMLCHADGIIKRAEAMA